MEELPYGEDPEPSERFPAGPLYVPVRQGPSGSVVRLFRTPLGDRSAVGFTSARGLVAALGTGQAWIRLAEPALRALTAPLGVTPSRSTRRSLPARRRRRDRPDRQSLLSPRRSWPPRPGGAAEWRAGDDHPS
jgi:hypothetical protein